jgi:hypothetical protein
MNSGQETDEGCIIRLQAHHKACLVCDEALARHGRGATQRDEETGSATNDDRKKFFLPVTAMGLTFERSRQIWCDPPPIEPA